MRFRCLTSFLVLLLCSCSHDTRIYDYIDIEKYQIKLQDMFSINDNHYFTYIYSYSCAYCEEIKNFIINERITNNQRIYFIPYTDDITITDNVENTIGMTDIKEFSILGTPSLIEIYDKKIVLNIAGKNEIVNYLKGGNYFPTAR